MISQNPLIFVLDLDGTIIGDCVYQTVIQHIDDAAKKQNIKTTLSKQIRESYDSSSKLIRPYFKYFIKHIRSQYPNSQFYIYTASNKEWATKEINLIEKSLNIKFNRPIFSRDDCIIDSFNQYKKSVNKILPKIQQKNKSYKLNKNNIIAIDNNDVFIDYLSNFILCPTYDCVRFCDAWKDMKPDVVYNNNMKNIIDKYISTNKVCKYGSVIENDEVSELRHKWYYKKLKKINSENKKYKHDTFWKKIANLIIDKKMLSFTDQNVELLRHHLEY
jgi:hypothetical protein